MYDAGLYLVVYRVDPFQQTGRCGYGQSHWAVATYCAYHPPDVAWCWPLPGQDSHIVLQGWSRGEGRGGEGRGGEGRGGEEREGGEKRRGERKESHRSSCSIKVPLPYFKFTLHSPRWNRFLPLWWGMSTGFSGATSHTRGSTRYATGSNCTKRWYFTACTLCHLHKHHSKLDYI